MRCGVAVAMSPTGKSSRRAVTENAGVVTMLANRDPADLDGVAVHLYRASKSMERRVFVDADGEMLIIPQQGALRLVTELGVLDVEPGSVALIPRGVKFRVELDAESRGYVAENHGAPFRLPDLGPIGSNGLANPRDFETPVAAFEDEDEPTDEDRRLVYPWP